MSDFAYNAEFLMKDGSLVQQDLEAPGWATKELLGNISIFTLVPKVPNTGWPLLRIHIPPNAKPVWAWRIFRILKGPDKQPMRIYGIGYKKRGSKPYFMWVVPGGHVESGTDQPLFAELLWRGAAPREG